MQAMQMLFFLLQDEPHNWNCAAPAAEVAAVHQTEELPTIIHLVAWYGTAVSSRELDGNKNIYH